MPGLGFSRKLQHSVCKASSRVGGRTLLGAHGREEKQARPKMQYPPRCGPPRPLSCTHSPGLRQAAALGRLSRPFPRSQNSFRIQEKVRLHTRTEKQVSLRGARERSQPCLAHLETLGRAAHPGPELSPFTCQPGESLVLHAQTLQTRQANRFPGLQGWPQETLLP